MNYGVNTKELSCNHLLQDSGQKELEEGVLLGSFEKQMLRINQNFIRCIRGMFAMSQGERNQEQLGREPSDCNVSLTLVRGEEGGRKIG